MKNRKTVIPVDARPGFVIYATPIRRHWRHIKVLWRWIYVSTSPWDWDQIGIKLGTKLVIYKARKIFVEKVYVNRLEWVITDQNRMKRGDPIEMNFENFEMQKWNIPADRAQTVDGKMRWFVYSSCLLPELWSLKCQKGSFLYFLLMTAKHQSQFGHLKDLI